MIVSLIRTVYFLRLKAENTAVTQAGHDYIIEKDDISDLSENMQPMAHVILFSNT